MVFILSVLTVFALCGVTLGFAFNDQSESTSEQDNTSMDTEEELQTDSESSDKIVQEFRTYKPSEEEIANLDIPYQINDEPQAFLVNDSQPGYIATADSESKNIRAWHRTEENDILVSEATYTNGINISKFTDEVKGWFPSNTVEELTINGHVAILHESESRICELQIITEKKLFTVAGADRETVLNIAEKINND